MKKLLPYFAIIAVGLSVAGGSLFYLQQSTTAKENYVPVPVPKQDIEMNAKLERGDIVLKEFPAEAILPGTVTDQGQLIGKYAAEKLKAGWPIEADSLTGDNIYEDKYIVVINVDYARSAGARPGNIVDVYCYKYEDQLWTPGQGATLVATNAIVLSVGNKNGKQYTYTEAQASGASFGMPVAQDTIGSVRLAVQPDQAPKVVPGAIPEDKHFVLVIKNKATYTNEEGGGCAWPTGSQPGNSSPRLKSAPLNPSR